MTDDDLPLTPAEQVLVDRAAAFTRGAITPNAASWERSRTPLPRDLVLDWSEIGLNGLLVSSARGGAGASYACKIRVAEAMARSCFATAFTLNLIQGFATRMEREGSPEQIRRYLPSLVSGRMICAPS